MANVDGRHVVVPAPQVLDWDSPDTNNDKVSSGIHSSAKRRLNERFSLLSQKLDRIISSKRKYCGCKRRIFLIFCSLSLLIILILAIGLGVGLRKGSGRSQNLPLPSNSERFQGDLTYYAPGLGACGITSSNGDNICAVSHIIFDAVSIGANPNANPLCGLKIRAIRYDEHANAQKSVDLKVVDRCTGCAPTDIDISPGAFEKLGDPALGRVHVTWAWLQPTPTTGLFNHSE